MELHLTSELQVPEADFKFPWTMGFGFLGLVFLTSSLQAPGRHLDQIGSDDIRKF